MKLKMIKGSYTEESVLYINAVMIQHGLNTVSEAIDLINSQDSDDVQKNTSEEEADSK